MERDAGVEPACCGFKAQRGCRQPAARVLDQAAGIGRAWAAFRAQLGCQQPFHAQKMQLTDHSEPVLDGEPQPIYCVLLHWSAVRNRSAQQVEIRHYSFDGSLAFESRLWESFRLGVALISASKNAWISRLKTKKERFLRLPCAYGGEANSPCLGITLI